MTKALTDQLIVVGAMTTHHEPNIVPMERDENSERSQLHGVHLVKYLTLTPYVHTLLMPGMLLPSHQVEMGLS